MRDGANAPHALVGQRKQRDVFSYGVAPQQLCGTCSCSKRAVGAQSCTVVSGLTRCRGSHGRKGGVEAGAQRVGLHGGPESGPPREGRKGAVGPAWNCDQLIFFNSPLLAGQRGGTTTKPKHCVTLYLCVGVSVRACVGARARMHTICACVCTCVCNASLPSAIAWLACSRCCRLLLGKYRS
jgi:hypothetical protein